MKALSLVPNDLLLHHRNNINNNNKVEEEGDLCPNNRVEATKVEEYLLHREGVEDMVVAVEAMERHSSSMAGEGLLSNKEAEEGTVVVVEDLQLAAHPDHQFPSCTKQAQFLTKLDSPLSLLIKQAHLLSHRSLLKWQSSFSRFPSGKRKLLVRPFNKYRSLARV